MSNIVLCSYSPISFPLVIYSPKSSNCFLNYKFIFFLSVKKRVGACKPSKVCVSVQLAKSSSAQNAGNHLRKCIAFTSYCCRECFHCGYLSPRRIDWAQRRKASAKKWWKKLNFICGEKKTFTVDSRTAFSSGCSRKFYNQENNWWGWKARINYENCLTSILD